VILGVMSDTHGRIALMHRVAEQMVAKHGVECILHLGDDYADAEILRVSGYDVRAVPGLWCPEYNERREPRTLVVDVGGVSIACAHSHEDWGPRERSADILLCGHTHRAAINRVGPKLYLNPGHLRGPLDRGQRASYAVIEITPETIAVTIHELDGAVRTACTARRREAAS